MRNNNGTLSSTCGNDNDVTGGRKTVESRYTLVEAVMAREGTEEGAVLIDMGQDDAVRFSDRVEVESVPSLETESDGGEEEEEEEWESDEESIMEDEEDAELNEGLAERLRILTDARALKTLAEAFLRPEKPDQVTDGAVFGRNYFGRPSALERKTEEKADEEANILADLMELKKVAATYLHPEVGVTGLAPENFGRNWFHRPSAPEEVEESDERALALAEATALKKSAVDYMCPEAGVTCAAGTCFGRNYFYRYSAPEIEEDDLADERDEILVEATALKKLATDNMHPEVGISATDGAAFGRNWFNRPSAPEAEYTEDAEERALVLSEAAALKKSAMDYMQPEVGVTSTAVTCYNRNYFHRYTAAETKDDDLADEHAEILAEAAALKKLAADYMHPEVGVTTTDGSAVGRNYFYRPSAPETEEVEDAEECGRVFADALALKESAMNYMHPEVGVATTDAACSRSYFNRSSAAETSDCEDEVTSVNAQDARLWLANERAGVLADAAALKKSAVYYLHPEVVITADATLFGRNYFNRPSTPGAESTKEVAEERALVLAEASVLNKLAADYMCPEVGVNSAAGACFGRNYFSRGSAPETDEDDLVDEHAEILAEATALKTLAIDYMHPEVGVTIADSTLFGRNYFKHHSASEADSKDDADERALVLAEVAALKKSAIDYMHPEVGVTQVASACFGRNYFNRYSTPETEQDDLAGDHAQILADVAALKKLAVDYMHPEVGVFAKDGNAFGRNWFNRYSASEVESNEDADERTLVLAEAAALKKPAVDYMRPEVQVACASGACFGRNYFNRYSALETKEDHLTDECAKILAEAAALKNLATGYMYPEIGVTTSDGTAFGRNFFTCNSAPEVKKQAGTPETSQDVAIVKNLAAAVKGANLPGTESIKFNSADQPVGQTKKSASTVNLFGLSEGVY
jgi:hypothetical protein